MRNKTILIISPQAWGKMFVSKHHYAVELAKRGNTVYFLNPPDQQGFVIFKGFIVISPSGIQPNLYLINHRLFFPYSLKFHWISLFHFFMKYHVKEILKKIGPRVDIVWSFDLGNIYPFSFFPHNTFKIFHPVDEPLNQTALDSGVGADVVFSVTKEILEKYQSISVTKSFINHGVSDDFLNQPERLKDEKEIKVGYTGNLLRRDIDRKTLLTIIAENPHVTFEFWGSIDNSSNLGATLDTGSTQFIDALRNFKNAILHGEVRSEDLANRIQFMDAFLICYDIQLDQSKGTNYHKIMEFLSTGKIVISNNVSVYKDQPHLVRMPLSRSNNNELTAIFKQTINEIELVNSASNRQLRKDFARDNSYKRQVDRIESVIKNQK
ncbi:MAG: hypothetical protein ACKO96_08190 [Flammeovirgaceae bacterium]